MYTEKITAESQIFEKHDDNYCKKLKKFKYRNKLKIVYINSHESK